MSAWRCNAIIYNDMQSHWQHKHTNRSEFSCNILRKLPKQIIKIYEEILQIYTYCKCFHSWQTCIICYWVICTYSNLLFRFLNSSMVTFKCISSCVNIHRGGCCRWIYISAGRLLGATRALFSTAQSLIKARTATLLPTTDFAARVLTTAKIK